MVPDYNKLDNPAWYALNEKHAVFATGSEALKMYNPAIVLFGGHSKKEKNISSELDKILSVNQSIFLFDEQTMLPQNYSTESVVECLQMVCSNPVPVAIDENIFHLNETNSDEMFALINEVFPGYYLKHTNRLGRYFGIFKDNKLVAIAGERLCMDGLTEISAVVTHPAYTSRGYAQQLIAYIHQLHKNAGIVSFLHTGSGNARAINIYELLGYKKRRLINVSKIIRLK